MRYAPYISPGLNREKLENSTRSLKTRYITSDLLADPEKIKGVLKDELIALRDKYGDDRVTEIQDVADEIDIEDLIEEEQCVYTLTHGGYIKRMPVSEYRTQAAAAAASAQWRRRTRTLWTRCSPPPRMTISCSSLQRGACS